MYPQTLGLLSIFLLPTYHSLFLVIKIVVLMSGTLKRKLKIKNEKLQKRGKIFRHLNFGNLNLFRI